MVCRSAARIREGLSWGSRWYKPKEGTLSGVFFDPGRLRSAGTGAQIWGKEKARSTTRLQAPACGRSGPFRSQTVWYHKKGGGVCGGTAGSCHTWSEAEVPAAAGGIWLCQMPWHQKKKAPFGALSFGAEDGTRTHTPKYWLLRPERLPFRHFRLFHFGPAHSQNSRPTSTRIIPFLALPCQFPGLSPPFGGCLSTGVVLG